MIPRVITSDDQSNGQWSPRVISNDPLEWFSVIVDWQAARVDYKMTGTNAMMLVIL